MTRYSSTMRDILMQIREGYSPKEIKMAIGIATDKRYKGGNMTGAVNAIEKIKKGLSNHPQVKAVLQRVNEAPEDMEPASPDEGSMAMDQLKFMAYAANKIMEHIQSGGEFPEWMQNKLSGTHEKMKSLYANIEHSEMKEEVELDEALPPHLAKLFDKDGNFKDPKKQKVFDRMMGDGIGKEIAQKMGRIKFRVQADSAKKKVMVYVDSNDEEDAQKALKNHPAYVSGALRVIPEAFNLEEGTWAIPDSPKAKAELKKLMSKPIKLGKEGDDASDALYSLIGDDELFDDLYVAGKKNPNGDARDIVKKHMKRLGIKEEVELEEKLKVSDGLGAWIDDFKKSDAPQFQGKSDEEKKNMAIAAFTDAGGKLEQKEETELDEAPKMKYALVGTDMKIYSMGSDERDLRLDRRSLEKRFKDVAPLKMARLKTAQSIGDKVDKSQLKEEEEPNKPDTAKAVDQMRDDKKKTRIAQLQLQIAKAQETINKLNAQEKPSE